MAMIEEWREIETERARVAAYLNLGGTIPRKGEKVEPVAVEVHPDAW
jgi:hypothetical protein